MKAQVITQYTMVEAKSKPKRINRQRTEQLGDCLVCKVWFAMFAAFALGTCLAVLFLPWQ